MRSIRNLAYFWFIRPYRFEGVKKGCSLAAAETSIEETKWRLRDSLHYFLFCLVALRLLN